MEGGIELDKNSRSTIDDLAAPASEIAMNKTTELGSAMIYSNGPGY